MSQTTIRTAMVATVCTGAGCRRRQETGQAARLAESGTALCPSCRERLERELRRLPALFEECARRLDISADRERDRVSGGSLPGLPLNTAAVEARSAIVSVLASWSAAVVQERGVRAPGRVVEELAGFLLRHVDWLAAHSAAGEFSQEVARLARRAARVVDLAPSRRVAIGGCVEDGCPGRLTAAVRPDGPGVPVEIICDATAGHRWPGHQWLQLSRLLGARTDPGATGDDSAAEVSAGGLPVAAAVPRTRWVSAAAVARLWNIPSGTVYRHASQQQWRRRTRQGRTYYHDADVHETLSDLRRST
ncbi:hypothetical protein SUDANB6_05848 [Streptomyces sp. enrichment culture]|uniref:hypothetical protein n=1 Tax=Streptomyces sp. enrichment culture TaxID=1795815 RepID=UPI003F56D435